jgi:type I restriction enzyme, S subunit
MSIMSAKLTEVSEINPRFRGESCQDHEVAFVPMAAVSAEKASIEVLETRRLSTALNGFSYFQDGDILVGKITPCFENNKIAQARIAHRHGFGSTEFHVIRPDLSKLDGRYLLHFLRQPNIRMEGARKMTGSAGQRRVPKQFLEQLEIPLPPPSEQRRIATILDQADALRAKRRQALAKLDTLTQSLFLDLFNTIQAEGPRIPFSELVEDFRYGTSNKSDRKGYPTLRIPNVAYGSLDLTNLKTVPVDDSEFARLKLHDGDLLFVRTNGNPDFVGRCAVFETKELRNLCQDPARFIYASYLIRARLKKGIVSPLFLQTFLETAEGRHALRRRCKTSAGQYNINTEGLGSIEIPVPSQALQADFESKLRVLGALKTTQRRSLSKLDALFSSIQNLAFRGLL